MTWRRVMIVMAWAQIAAASMTVLVLAIGRPPVAITEAVACVTLAVDSFLILAYLRMIRLTVEESACWRKAATHFANAAGLTLPEMIDE